ncbi:MAG: zinc ribbon domain-containing protein [Methanomassiliicoccales archaeon]|nr:zinc ribbon domain-containing protein [Methanomassiliicoccales archaeon]
MSVLDAFNDKMKGLRQSKDGLIVGLVLTVLVTVLLTVVSYLWLSDILCFLPMLVALLAYGIPTYFGLKDRKKLAVFGLVLFLIIGLSVGAALYTTIANYEGDPLSSDDNTLVQGTVTPIDGVPGDTYTFNVTLTSGSNSSMVRLLLTNNWGDENGNRNLTMLWVSNSSLGRVYQLQLDDLDEGIYYYQYTLDNGTNYVITDQNFGPVNADMNKVLSNSLVSGILVSYVDMALLFYILVLMTWWMDRSKKKVYEMEQKRTKVKEKKAVDEKFVCSDCGADVPADADKCPACGASFEEEKELLCPQCSAKLLKTDEKCWNCGKKL